MDRSDIGQDQTEVVEDMKPILFESTETLFASNGLGRLSDCISCRVSEERNGIYECEFEYPTDGAHYADIIEGRIVLCSHDESGDLQPFDIYGHSKTIDGVTTFYAHHISYRQSGITVKPFTATSLADTLTKIKANSVNTNPFNYSTDKAVSTPFKLESPRPLKAILGGEEGSLLDVYGTGEYEWNRFQVILHMHRGVDTGFIISYGKNLISLQDDIDYSDSYNGIVPFWFGQTEPDDGTEAQDVIVTLTEWVLYKSGSTYDGRNTVIPVDLSGEFEHQPTEAQLRTAAQAYLNKGNPLLPTDTLELDFIELSKTTEYSFLELQQVKLCDTVRVRYEDMDVAMKVIRTDWDVLNDKYEKITLGDAPQTYAALITDRLAEIAEKAAAGARLAKFWATNALSIAGNTNQYFWFTGTGTDTGAHITEKPRDQFLLDPSHGGGNLLARSNGIAVRDGLTELATFGQNGARIGLSTSGHVDIISTGMEVFNNTTSLAYFGSTARVGATGSGYVNIQSNGIDMYAGSTNLAHIGYDVGTNPSGSTSTDKLPYYTFGTRSSGAIGNYSSVLGIDNVASGYNSHAEGRYTTASGHHSHTEGVGGTASGLYSHAEGDYTEASGQSAHAEGGGTNASGTRSHAEGFHATASGGESHAEGHYTVASNYYAHAQGENTTANGVGSFATGYHSTANGAYQTAIGKYNIINGSTNSVANTDHAFIIGNGTSDSSRSNALTVDWSGNVTASGSMTAGGNLYLNNTKTIYLNSSSSEYSNVAIWADTGSQGSAYSLTNNLKLQADGYMSFLVGQKTSGGTDTVPSVRYNFFYDSAYFYGGLTLGGNLLANGTVRGASGWSGNLVVDGGITVKNGSGINSYNSNGTAKTLAYLTSSNAYIFGATSYANSEDAVYYRGNKIYIQSKDLITITSGSAGINLATSTMCSSNLTIANNISLRWLNSSSSAIAMIYLSNASTNHFYVGNTSYPTTLRGSTIASSTTISQSDIRLKTNIQDLDSSTDSVLLGLDTFAFKWNKGAEDRDERKHYGVSAQQLMEQLKKQGISTDKLHLVQELEGQYYVCYTEIIPMLIHLCQSQQKEIEMIKEKLQ